MGNSFLTKNMTAILGILIAGVAVGFSVSSYNQLQQELQKANSLAAEIEKVQAEKADISEKIEELKQERQSVNDRLRKYSEDTALLRQDINRLTQQKQTLSEEYSKKEKAFSELNTKLSSAARYQQELRVELDEARAKHQKAADELDALAKEKAELEEQIKENISTPEGIELKKIVVKVTSAVEGEIVEVNREFNFSIVNLGAKDGIKNSELVGIYRNDTLVAEAVVENVYEDMSSVIIPNDWADAQISIGDKVRILSS